MREPIGAGRVSSCLSDFFSQGKLDNLTHGLKDVNFHTSGGDESTLQGLTQNGIKTCITCRFCESGSGICARRLCDLCDSMLCAQCVQAHSTVVLHSGKTACQLWAANDRINFFSERHPQGNASSVLFDPTAEETALEASYPQNLVSREYVAPFGANEGIGSRHHAWGLAHVIMREGMQTFIKIWARESIIGDDEFSGTCVRGIPPGQHSLAFASKLCEDGRIL
eukprot:1526395-Karenia_brevis.AAC.1